MALPVPRLDDRSYAELVAEALAVIDRTCPGWTDRSPSDPGITLVELFAFLTENLLYRVNRIPAKLLVALLNLVGVERRPPAAAMVALCFRRTGGDGAIVIPDGTRVGSTDGSLEFLVTQGGTIAAGSDALTLPALHCEWVDGELAGQGTGAPGQALTLNRAPVIAASGDGLDLVLGVEAGAGELPPGTATRVFAGTPFRIWRECSSFADAGPDDPVYRVDRVEGLIRFAPAREAADGALAAVPGLGRDIRVWYRRGGGRAGNVTAGSLTVLKTPLAKVTVGNPAPASGGADGETVAEAVRRCPLDVTAMRCAVTARDFERLALASGGIARAKAFAQGQVWRHAEPGVVELLLVPSIEAGADGAVGPAAIAAGRSDALKARVDQAIDGRRPLGVRLATGWAKVRPVAVAVRVVVSREEDRAAVRSRLATRLNALFSPLRDRPFGAALRASDAYETILSEPGVRYADQLRFTIGEAPAREARAVLRDPHQPRCWYAATAEALHRSLDDGDSWSVVHQAAGQRPVFVARHRDRPGLMALGVALDKGSAVHLSRDCGESWTASAAAFASEISDADWITRDGTPVLLIATADGLMQVQPGSGTGPAPVVVDQAIDAKGYYGVAAITSPSGVISVAVAARMTGGVYLSTAGGVSETFRPIGLKGRDIRTVAIQRFNARDYLWAAVRAEAGQQGDGAMRIELRAGGADDPDGWKPFNIGWQGGSCEDLSFAGGTIVAGSNRAGILVLDIQAAAPSWTPTRLDAGLPIRDAERLLHVVAAVAAESRPDGTVTIFAAGPQGVYRSADGGARFALNSATEFTDRIPLPANWLYCAGDHDIAVVTDETES